MTMRLVRRKGKESFVIDTRPSKTIRKAKNRVRLRMLEIYRHFPVDKLSKPKEVENHGK